MPIDDRTTNRSYQLPNAANLLAEDVVRLRAALAAIDADVFARYTKLEVDQLVTNLIAGAPGALNTLDELATALGDDANFAATVTNQLALKANASNVYSKAESDGRYVQGSVQTEMVFIATANQSVFTLSTAVINKPSALVTVDGVVQPTSEYSLNMSGTQLTLSEGVPVGTVVRVLALGVASAGAPADDTVTTAKLRDGAVTTEKIALGAVVTADLADGAVTPAKLSQPLTLRTAVAATSGTSIDFTSIPSWVKRVTVMFNGVSTNGTSFVEVRLGTSAGIQTSGYNCASSAVLHNSLTGVNVSDTGATVLGSTANASRVGSIVFNLFAGNTWSFSGVTCELAQVAAGQCAGLVALSGALDRIRLTTVNGTDTFDDGTVNILYEG
jgi:hypothetical protein